MKKIYLALIVLLLAVGVYAKELSLDEAITHSVNSIEGILPHGTSVLILEITQASDNFSNTVMNEISDQLAINEKINIVDRQSLSAIRNELNLHLSGDVSDESALSIGRHLGAHYIVSGILEDRRNAYRLRLRIISIETTRVLSSIIIELKKDAQVAFLIGGETAVREEEIRQQVERARRPANIKDNWILVSGGLLWEPFMGDMAFPFSIGIQYERMLSSILSVGANFYYGSGFLSDDKALGIEGLFHIYPFTAGGVYCGVLLGYGSISTVGEIYESISSTKKIKAVMEVSGFAITPEIGSKIVFGDTGGWYFQSGLGLTLLFGEGINYNLDFAYIIRMNLGIGYAF
jgi:TolB-like protein